MNIAGRRLVAEIHAAATLFMVGLIWFVQLVHYPLFASADPSGFAVYEQRHSELTTRVVGPAMLIEAVTAAVLIAGLSGADRHLATAGLGLLAVIWLSTWFLQVPCHDQLNHGFDPVVHSRLVKTNWIRTIAWSVRGLVAIRLLRSSHT
jgi:type IV secretory pathway TrbD component